MRKIVNSTIRLYLKSRYNKMEYSIRNPSVSQADMLENLLFTASETEFGSRYDFKEIRHYDDFRAKVPACRYDEIKEDIRRMMLGEQDVLWPGKVNWYAKSSGTTSDKSKFIPVSRQCLKHCHVKGFWDALSILYHNHPEAKIFEFNNLVVGGTLYDFPENPETRYGDVSAILIHEMPLVGRPFYSPDFETAFMKQWDEKLERTAQLASKDRDIGSIGGVPTWNIVLFRRILELTGKSHLLEVWPNLEVYLHGGVSFEPYREQFQALIPRDDFIYQEVYNASEGYFGCQFDLERNDLMLFPDCGIFYEFVPLDKLDNPGDHALSLQEISVGVNYAMMITTNAGLWRYLIGDTVMFTEKYPFRLKVTGRTKHFINVFGEEVMVSNTDEAISITCRKMNVKIRDYTVAPIFLTTQGRGGHEWLVEFDGEVPDLDIFASMLDKTLQGLNSDYEAKRYGDLALTRLQVKAVPAETFARWLASKGKVGAQVKVPRLSNKREVLEDVLMMVKDQAPA